MVGLQLLEKGNKKNFLLTFLSIFMLFKNYLYAISDTNIDFECLSEDRVSGLFQMQRKFLKDSEYFPYKTIMSFNDNYELLHEKDNTLKQEGESKYTFQCKKSKDKLLLTCTPIGVVKTYQIKFSLNTLRYRKSMITDFWIEGEGNEIDYIHISLGYCYRINN